MTPIYRSVSVLEVKPQDRKVLDNGQVEDIVAGKEFFETQIELLRSQTLAKTVVKALNLTSDTYFYTVDDSVWASKLADEKFRIVVEAFEDNLGVDAVGRSRLIEISFQHSDPAKASDITNALTNSFINNAAASDFDPTAYARDFLETRLQAAKTSLENAERALIEYTRTNDVVYTEEGTVLLSNEPQNTSSVTTLLAELDAELSLARSERVTAEQNHQQAIGNNFETYALSHPVIIDLMNRKAALQSEYQEKQLIFKPNFPDMIDLKSRMDILDQKIAQQTVEIVENRRAEIYAEFNRMRLREESLNTQLALLKNSVAAQPKKSVDYDILKDEVETQRAQYDQLLSRLNGVAPADKNVPNLVQILDLAQAPLRPIKPNKFDTLLWALLLSTALGLSLAFTLDTLDDRVKTPDDIKSQLNQIIMGVIPVAEKGADITENLKNSQTIISEAYASLRTNIQYFSSNGGPRVVQITSTRPGEGKSVSSLGLSLRFAGLQGRILLIDADMRRPTFAPSESGTLGLSDLLSADTEFTDHILPTHYNNLYLMTSGASVPNSSELLSSRRFDALIDFARANYDYVIIDSPPVLGLADAPIMGAKADATLLVVEANQLRAPSVRLTIERLRKSGTEIMGVLLTKYSAPAAGYMDSYSYSYGKASSDYGAPKRSKASAKLQQQRKLDITN